VTAFKVDPARLAALNPRLRGMRLGNFEFASEQLRLGDLQGNR
jgi:tRNA(Glu) U13 pseudouridine synthase TruD